MNRLRRLTTLAILIAVFFGFRLGWQECLKLGLTTSPLMQANVYSTPVDHSNYEDKNYSLGLVADEDIALRNNVVQSKAYIEDEKLGECLELLRSTPSGKSIADNLDENQVKITFGTPKTPGAAAVYVPSFLGNSGTIIVSERLREAQPSVICAILAHEGTHAEMGSIFNENSVEQEYKCYIAQAKVWDETRVVLSVSVGKFEAELGEPSPENDYALDIMNMEKDEAYDQIRKDYKQIGIDLPMN